MGIRSRFILLLQCRLVISSILIICVNLKYNTITRLDCMQSLLLGLIVYNVTFSNNFPLLIIKKIELSNFKGRYNLLFVYFVAIIKESNRLPSNSLTFLYIPMSQYLCYYNITDCSMTSFMPIDLRSTGATEKSFELNSFRYIFYFVYFRCCSPFHLK